MVMKVAEGDSAFNTEMQNNPLDPDNQIFLREWFQYFTLKEIKPKFKELELFAAIDASMGKKNNSDFSAIVVLAKNKKTGQMYCLECNMKRRHPDQIIDDAADILLYWMDLIKQPFKVLGVEDVAFQSFFKDELRKRFMAKNIYVNINGLSNNQDKQLRIERLQPDIKNGYIKFLRDQKLLLEQLEYFPLAAHDDGPDALEMARRLIGRSVKLLK
jgi:predicted phage terminase large subunit-like protein